MEKLGLSIVPLKWIDINEGLNFMERHTGDNTKSKDTAFRRTRKSLVVKKYLKVKNDIYSFGDTAT